ncbi:Hypp5223 [Branchiostoma lanceolatum]|uniref:Hypp5223 protein n=1 Tax=Branchiostoma lanceolatum TaxID=7740 RepID=A0A8K0AE93_BRALA|nr:Hypp5223 [Branchiostoma lanceolatum]
MPPIGYRHREAIPKTGRKRNTGRRKTRNSARKRPRSRSKDKTQGSERQRTSVKHKPSCRHHRKNNTGTGRNKISLEANVQDIQQYLHLQERSKIKKGCCQRRAEGSDGRPVHCPGCRSSKRRKSQVDLQEDKDMDGEEVTKDGDHDVRSQREPYNTTADERGLRNGKEEDMIVLIGEDNNVARSEKDSEEESPFRKPSLKHETCGNAGKLQCSRQGPLICGTIHLIPSILMTLLAFTLYGHPIVPLHILGPVLVSLCFLMIVVGATHQIISTIRQLQQQQQRRRASNDEVKAFSHIEETPTGENPEEVLILEDLVTDDKEPGIITDNVVVAPEEVDSSEDDDSDSSTEDDAVQAPLIVEALTSSPSTESTGSGEDICFIDETEKSDSPSSSEAEYTDR